MNWYTDRNVDHKRYVEKSAKVDIYMQLSFSTSGDCPMRDELSTSRRRDETLRET